ncbi:MAG: HEAT repeat domain-containing protein [Nitrospirae bacterium]|nr:HEAT repeat domain-containing protein [Nitrospirota bacterium]
MHLLSNPDLLVRIASWSAFAVGGLVLAMLGVISTSRLVLNLRERRRQLFLATWRPLLAESLEEPLVLLPPVSKFDGTTLLGLWNYYYESLRGDAHERLAYAAGRVGLDEIARRHLRARSRRRQLLAIATLGNLRHAESWSDLERLALHESPMLSITAARALIRIDAQRAMPALVPLFAAREDWPPATVAAMLSEAGPAVASGPLATVVDQTAIEHLPRLIRFLELADPHHGLPPVRRLLENPPEDRIIAPCLRVLARFADPHDLSRVRRYLDHPRWHIRAQAAAALGKMGTEDDVAPLTRLLVDKEWWVRYRAAQALVGLPFLDGTGLKKLTEDQKDRYARDILAQALAEKEMA